MSFPGREGGREGGRGRGRGGGRGAWRDTERVSREARGPAAGARARTVVEENREGVEELRRAAEGEREDGLVVAQHALRHDGGERVGEGVGQRRGRGARGAEDRACHMHVVRLGPGHVVLRPHGRAHGRRDGDADAVAPRPRRRVEAAPRHPRLAAHGLVAAQVQPRVVRGVDRGEGQRGRRLEEERLGVHDEAAARQRGAEWERARRVSEERGRGGSAGAGGQAGQAARAAQPSCARVAPPPPPPRPRAHL